MGYCFYCDRPVDGETCPTCGRRVWVETTDQVPSPRPDASHLRRVGRQRATPTPRRSRDRTPTGTTPTPTSSPAPPAAGGNRRGVIAAVLLVAGLLATVIAIPSGFERVTAPKPPPPSTTTTTTIPLPGSTRPAFALPPGTFVAAFGPDAWVTTGSGPAFRDGTPLGVTLDQIGTPLGILADFSLIAQSGEDLVLATPDGGIRPLGSPTTVAEATVSPNGLLVGIRDILGNPWVWDSSSELFEKLSPEWYTGSLVAGPILWSPDSRLVGMQTDANRFLLIDVTQPAAQNTEASGSLLAIGNRHVVTSDGDEVHLLTLDRSPLRVPGTSVQTWGVATAGAAEVDPTGTLVAITGTMNDRTGLWIVRVGDPAITFVGEDPLDFAWSGDGTVLYWAHPNGVSAFPRDDLVVKPGEIVGSDLEPDTRLHIYDRKLVAAPSRLLADGTSLSELRSGVIFARTPDGVFSVNPEDSLTTTSIQLLGSQILRTAVSEESVELQSFDPRRGTITGIYRAGDLGVDEQLIRTALYSSEPLFAYAETSRQRILGLSDPDELPASLVMPEGHSLGKVGRVIFAIGSDGRQLAPLALPQTTAPLRALLDAGDLPGVTRIVAAAGIRTDLFVVVELATGEHALYLIPGDSKLLEGLVLPNVPDEAQSDWLAISRFSDELADFRFLTPPVGHVAALSMESLEGPQTLIIEDPVSPLSRCGISPCIVSRFAGMPLGFSPDGSWLVVTRDGAEIAVSTTGRGEQRLDLVAPEQIVWIPAP